MPMPRTKVQGLGAHVSSMANGARSYVFGSGGDRGSQQSKNLKGGAGPLGDDDTSSDSSSSDSDSDISDAEGTQKFLSKINAATAASKKARATEPSANGSANKSASQSTPKPSAAESAQKKGTKASDKSPAISSSQHKIATIKKESAEDDSDDATSSDDSSEEDNAQAKNLKQAAKPTAAGIKPKAQDDSTSSDSSSSEADSSGSESSDSESEDKGKNAGAKLDSKSGKKAAPVTEAVDDSSSVSDSESDEEAANAKSSALKASNVPAQISKPTKVAAKDAPSSESESDSDSESSEEEDNQSLKTKATPKKVAASAVLNGKSKSRDVPSATKASKASKVVNTAAEESSSEEDSDVEMADESFALAQNDDASPGDVEEFVREGFQLRKAADNTQPTEVLEMFKKAKREGKQIWYFTTPASVPISVIEKMEFPMKNAQTGDSIVSHNGVDYGVDLGASGKPSAFQILVPAKKGASYGIVDRPVDHTMHLKRITQLAATDFTAKPKPQISYTKPPRAQPADLKRRFTPIGVPTPILPPPVPNPSKRTADVLMADAASEGKGENQESKKSKKRKLAEDGDKTSKGDKKSKKAKGIPGAPLPTSQPVKKASPVPVPNLGGRAPSLSQPTSAAAAAVSTPGTGKAKKSKASETANGTPGSATPSGKTKKLKPARSDSSIRRTPIPVPMIPGMKK